MKSKLMQQALQSIMVKTGQGSNWLGASQFDITATKLKLLKHYSQKATPIFTKRSYCQLQN